MWFERLVMPEVAKDEDVANHKKAQERIEAANCNLFLRLLLGRRRKLTNESAVPRIATTPSGVMIISNQTYGAV